MALGMAALGTPRRRQAASPELQRRASWRMLLGFAVWIVGASLGVLGGYLYDTKSATALHLLAGGFAAFFGLILLGLLLTIALGVGGFARRRRR